MEYTRKQSSDELLKKLIDLGLTHERILNEVIEIIGEDRARKCLTDLYDECMADIEDEEDVNDDDDDDDDYEDRDDEDEPMFPSSFTETKVAKTFAEFEKLLESKKAKKTK